MLKHHGYVVRCVIWFCMLGITAAKCDPEKCGSTSVSYPFWIDNSACGHPGFQITCREDYNGKMAPFFNANFGNNTDMLLYAYNIMGIDYTGHLIIDSFYIYSWTCDDDLKIVYFELPSDGPLTISSSNRFVVVGCNTSGTYSFGGLGEVRCVAICEPQIDRPYCRYGCSETNLPNNWPSINFTGEGTFDILNHTTNKHEKVCGFSTIFDRSTFKILNNKSTLFWKNYNVVSYGLRLNWGIGLHNCSVAKASSAHNYSCSSKAECIDSPSGKGHVCRCLPGYEGNGYINGTDCTDTDECNDNKMRNMCVGEEGGGICLNSVGSYSCSCAKGYRGDGFRNGTGCVSTNSNRIVIPTITGSLSSFVVVCLAATLVVWWLKKRNLKLLEAKYLQQLQQHITSRVGRESLRMFSAKELERASNNYSNDMVLGSGGFGAVFKGVLLDGTLVAIKKSKQALNLDDDHEFLNEVAILSQINHKNK